MKRIILFFLLLSSLQLRAQLNTIYLLQDTFVLHTSATLLSMEGCDPSPETIGHTNLFSIAVTPNGNLWATGLMGNLSRIDPITRMSYYYMSVGYAYPYFVNSLTAVNDNLLIGYESDSRILFSVDLSNQTASVIDTLPYPSDGDIAFMDGMLYYPNNGSLIVVKLDATYSSVDTVMKLSDSSFLPAPMFGLAVNIREDSTEQLMGFYNGKAYDIDIQNTSCSLSCTFNGLNNILDAASSTFKKNTHATGINNMQVWGGLSIFPNPASQQGMVNIALGSIPKEAVSVTIFNGLGQMIYNTHSFTKNGNLSIDLKNIKTISGIYTVECSYGNHIAHGKIMIQ